jgi:uncharacterized protein (TIGR04255 family)
LLEPARLPEYKTPPLIEVVCGVQFATLEGFSSVHIGAFWQRMSAEYPTTEDKPPLPEVFEQQVPSITTDLLMALPLPRVFFIDRTGSNLLQVQSSRFLANWRRRSDEEEYPRFHAAYGRFSRGWAEFLKLLADFKIGRPQVNQYELTYINHVPTETPADIERHLPFFSWCGGRARRYLPDPRGVTINLQAPLQDVKGGLHVAASFGRRQLDKKGVLLLELTARGPGAQDGSDMDTWFEIAHRNVVLGFADLISQPSQASWGLSERRDP